MTSAGSFTEPRDLQALEAIRGYVGPNCVPSPERIEALGQTDLVLVSGQFVGAGKSTFIRELEQEGRANIPSYTNRDLRRGEVEGIDKVTVSLGQLATLAENGELLELEEVRPGVFYATPARLNPHKRYVKDIELKGALRLRKYSPHIPIVVPVPPLREVETGDLTEWERRVAIRDGYRQAITDNDVKDLHDRLWGVVEEVDRISHEGLIDDPNLAIIINDDLSVALSSMKTFLATGEIPQRPDELGGYLRSIRLAGYLHGMKELAATAIMAQA